MASQARAGMPTQQYSYALNADSLKLVPFFPTEKFTEWTARR